MENKLLILIYFIVDSLTFVYSEGNKNNQLLFGSIDVKAQAPFTLTYQESLTGYELNMPFHYSLVETGGREPQTFNVYSYFSKDMIGSLYIYSSDLFDSEDGVALISNSSDIIKYQDKKQTVYQATNTDKNLYLAYHELIDEIGIYIVYESNRDRKTTILNGNFAQGNHLETGSNHPIINDLRFAKGLTLRKYTTVDSIPQWVEYEKEIPTYDADLHTNTVSKIQEAIVDFDVGESQKISIDQWRPAIEITAIDSNDVVLNIFNNKFSQKELLGYLKRVDEDIISSYGHYHKIDTVYKDDHNLIVSFKDNNNYPQNIYLSVVKLSKGGTTILMSIPSTTKGMADFYLSYFHHIQEIIKS